RDDVVTGVQTCALPISQIVRGSVHHVDFVLLAVRYNAGWAGAHSKRCLQLKCPQINHRDGVAFAVGYVRIFAVSRIETRKLTKVEVPPAKPCQDRQQNNDEEDFAHVGEPSRVSKSYRWPRCG